MLWFKKLLPEQAAQDFNKILPAELPIKFDDEICRQKVQQLLNETEVYGGISGFVDALKNKQALFLSVLSPENIDNLTPEGLSTLIDTVFTARRKLPNVISEVPHDVLVRQIKFLLHGNDKICNRISQFVEVIESDNRKVKKAAWDFAAELLHFYSPEKFPHMSRWVWHDKETSGSLREFIRGGDSMHKIPLGNTPENFEASRVWFAQQLGQQGFYRDIHYLIDLLMAQAYAEYVLSMSSGMGMFGSQFGGGELQPIEFVIKLLGIDPPRKKPIRQEEKAVVH